MLPKIIPTLIFLVHCFCNPVLAQNVIEIPIVVHVLYNQIEDSIPAELIQTVILDSVNADFRRQNADAIYTQTAYLPIAADTEIEFRFADTDPYGIPTNGINYEYTEVPSFDWNESQEMMHDSLGGSDSWDECRYLNIWICRMSSQVRFNSSWQTGSPIGIAINPTIISSTASVSSYYRYLTHEFAHFLSVPFFYASFQCIDDGIDDTPIQSSHPNAAAATNNPDSIFEETNCDPIPEGQLAGNFMTYTNPYSMQHMNMFTVGQKERMRNFIAERFPGYIDPEVSCFTSVNEGRDLLQFEVYPNPSNGTINISTQQIMGGKLTLLVRDLFGREVQYQSLSDSERQVIELELSAGIYYVTISGESFSSTEKVIVN